MHPTSEDRHCQRARAPEEGCGLPRASNPRPLDGWTSLVRELRGLSKNLRLEGGGGLAAPPPRRGGYKGRLSFSNVFHAISMTNPLALSQSVTVIVTVTVSLRGGGGGLSAVPIHPPLQKHSDIGIEEIRVWPLEPLSATPPSLNLGGRGGLQGPRPPPNTTFTRPVLRRHLLGGGGGAACRARPDAAAGAAVAAVLHCRASGRGAGALPRDATAQKSANRKKNSVPFWGATVRPTIACSGPLCGYPQRCLSNGLRVQRHRWAGRGNDHIPITTFHSRHPFCHGTTAQDTPRGEAV